ncbi:hypothetical protein RE428_31990 [Marinobacter nanhaiticus D15-8W]|uniref:Uncharacterized protein n=1 Tax=Marinobacter nanhaiticus D15-8W TaxID=626887 RepID=N6X0C1_9GAMM|nr:hypothetical protein [Marinobacter nanhaiticus]ENO16892.1 hypothetical protein J057_01770 [Marinobacter nanhaiticus D15-8W]BES72181.1 hypothetical protein RE428_31990 [Marinobacter nanhaiticus D15-8W]
MAEQNRKTDVQREWRRKAQQEVEIYLDYLFADADQQSIIGESRSVMGIAADFWGQIPKGSGFSGFCTLGHKVDRMHRREVSPRQQLAAERLRQLSEKQRGALCVERCFRGKTKVVARDPFVPESGVEITYHDGDCAEMLDCTVQVFRQRVSDGYARLEQVMGFVAEEKRAA